MNNLDILSWSATFFILLSFLFDGRLLRYLNICGGVLWFVWGMWVNQPSVYFLNIMIVLIHIWKLSKASREKFKNKLKKFFENRHDI